MNVLNHQRLSQLLGHRATPSVSLFMPTHRAGPEKQQDTIRLKNLIGEAREQIVGNDNRAAVADTVLKPAAEMRSDESFWLHRSEGLSCFCSREFFRAYRVPIKLDEQVFVDDRFHIRPLLPLLRSDARLYILALTQESARLFEATKYSIREVELSDISKVEIDGEQQPLQYHSHNAPAQGKGATEAAIYHGHGGPADRAKKDSLRFFQRVDRAVTSVLQGQRSPLVLACIGYLASLYESACSYPYLLKGKLPGSPDRWSLNEMRDHAWEIVKPYFQQSQQKAWEEFQGARGSDRASDELRRVVLAADEGRIDTLFLAQNDQRWGYVEPQLQALHVVEQSHEGDELLDYAAARTLSTGGRVYLLESLPSTDSPIAATFRY